MDTENRTSRKRNAFATALLTTLAFALGFAEFVLIGITPDVAEGWASRSRSSATSWGTTRWPAPSPRPS